MVFLSVCGIRVDDAKVSVHDTLDQARAECIKQSIKFLNCEIQLTQHYVKNETSKLLHISTLESRKNIIQQHDFKDFPIRLYSRSKEYVAKILSS